MRYFPSGFAIALAMILLFLPTRAVAQCDCQYAGLTNTSISAYFSTPTSVSPTRTDIANNLIEIPNAALAFGAGASANMSVDYGAWNTIMIGFAGSNVYGPGLSLTFTNLNPLMPPPLGCTATPEIVGVQVQTPNRSDATFVAANITFTAHSVTVPITGSTGFEWHAPNQIMITMTYACGSSPTSNTGTCCPPLNTTNLKSMLFYSGTGAIDAPYTLRFLPTLQFHNQMNAYIAYLQTFGFTSMTVKFELLDGGIGANSVPNGTILWASQMTWTGSGQPSASFFPPGLTVPNHWYRVRTTIILTGGPGSSYLPASCVYSNVDVRLQVL